MSQQNENKIKELLDKLESLGKDASEIKLWKNLLPTMTEEESSKLLTSYVKFVSRLKKLEALMRQEN